MAERPGRDFADKLNHLFAVTKSPEGDEISNDFAADSITAAGTKISGTYIWQLRKRKRDNPTIKHVEGLGRFFGVPVNYFFDDDVTDRVDQQLRDLAAEQERLKANAGDQEAQRIAMRAGELTPDRRQLVMDLLDVVYRDQQAARERGER
ncbi:XRE family transcriptional regulator [Amycolatopsis sp. NPDC005003]